MLFLGSGISATASTEDGIKPKTWGQFIEGIKSIARNASEDDMKYINEQIKKEDYLLALQAIYDACIPADYVRYLKSEFMVDFKPSKVHEFIRKIDSKVVITTNSALEYLLLKSRIISLYLDFQCSLFSISSLI